MSIVQKEGKDTIIFASKEDHAEPSTVKLPDPEPSPGLILPDGEINWNCPCLGGMATGPCGVEFREAFSCFHYSTSEPKGANCYEAFKTMQSCMVQYPALYGDKEPDLDELNDEGESAKDKEEDTTIQSKRRNSIHNEDQEHITEASSKTNIEKISSN